MRRVGGSGGPFAFEHGLSAGLLRADRPRLPEAPDLPSEGTDLPQQLELLYPRNPLDTLIEDALRPDLADRAVLAPAAFEAALEEVPALLADMVRRQGPATRPLAEAAARILDGVLSDRLMLDQARNALSRA